MGKVLKMYLTSLFFWLSFFAVGIIYPQVVNAEVTVITIDGSINPVTDDFLKSSLKTAKENSAKLIVLNINTPGGLLTSTQSMVSEMLKSEVPVAVYVNPTGGGAISAGVFITLAGHFAAMAPGTNIGAAHPVSGSGQDIEGDSRTKVENFAASLIKAIAEQRGRNVGWAEEAVRKSVAITDKEAVEKKVVDFVASDLTELLKKIEGKTVKVNGKDVTLTELGPVKNVEMTFRQKVLNLLSDPNIAIIIGLAAMLGLGIEFYHPGGIFPGVFGGICFILSLSASSVLPLDVTGLILLGLAVVFFILEAMSPTFGLWGVAGVICMVLGSIYVIDRDLVFGVDAISVDTTFVATMAAVFGSIILLLAYLAASAQSGKVTTGKEGLIGKIGRVRTGGGESRGKIDCNGEIWSAEAAENQTLPPDGEEVVVKGLGNGLTLIVEKK